MQTPPHTPLHPRISRRLAVQAGAIGLLGLGMNHLAPLRAAAAPITAPRRDPKAKSVIYIFLSGGLAQHESFDMKPDAPAEIRGEFKPIPTKTPACTFANISPNSPNAATSGPFAAPSPIPTTSIPKVT